MEREEIEAMLGKLVIHDLGKYILKNNIFEDTALLVVWNPVKKDFDIVVNPDEEFINKNQDRILFGVLGMNEVANATIIAAIIIESPFISRFLDEKVPGYALKSKEEKYEYKELLISDLINDITLDLFGRLAYPDTPLYKDNPDKKQTDIQPGTETYRKLLDLIKKEFDMFFAYDFGFRLLDVLGPAKLEKCVDVIYNLENKYGNDIRRNALLN
jgi:hypothetical protein